MLGMAKPPKNDDERSPRETERIREATLKKLLSTPPKPHAEMIKDRHRPVAKPKSKAKSEK
jgi:hypothetical protein